MGFDIEQYVSTDENSQDTKACFESFAEVVKGLIIPAFGSRLQESLMSCFVDDLDLPEEFISSLQEQAAKKAVGKATPSKGQKQDQLEKYYSSLEPSP